jgi:hypothetical protein
MRPAPSSSCAPPGARPDRSASSLPRTRPSGKAIADGGPVVGPLGSGASAVRNGPAARTAALGPRSHDRRPARGRREARPGDGKTGSARRPAGQSGRWACRGSHRNRRVSSATPLSCVGAVSEWHPFRPGLASQTTASTSWRSTGDPLNFTNRRLPLMVQRSNMRPKFSINVTPCWAQSIPCVKKTCQMMIGLWLVGLVAAQEPATFEAVSIRPNTSGLRVSGERNSPGRLIFSNTTPSRLIQLAYGVQGRNVIGPDSLAGDRYDITATVAAPLTRAQMRPMLQGRPRRPPRPALAYRNVHAAGVCAAGGEGWIETAPRQRQR